MRWKEKKKLIKIKKMNKRDYTTEEHREFFSPITQKMKTL